MPPNPTMVTPSSSLAENRVVEGRFFKLQKLGFALLVLATFASFVYFVIWADGRPYPPGRRWISLSILAVFMAPLLFHTAMTCLLGLRFKLRPQRPAPSGKKVDIFLTTFDEPTAMIRQNLAAAVAVRYPHSTYLLDDAGRPELQSLARQLGAHYIARPGQEHHKAGNVNYALTRSDGDLVAIFDADHRPERDFLDHTVGYFDDPEIGFVQIMITFDNDEAGLFERASAQTALDYYNIAAVGKDRCAAAGLMGSNAVLRRSALEDIGFYRPGLAEDLETSLALHAAGWQSAYVRRPLAPGQTPADLPSFMKQQLKWASGVFEAALRSFRGPFWKLTGLQKLCYLTRFTYYLLGAMVLPNMLAVAATLFWPIFDIENFTVALLPLTLTAFATRTVPLRLWSLQERARKGFLFKGISLVASSWPAYSLAAVTSLLRRPVPFVPTPKGADNHLPMWSYLPQTIMISIMLCAVGWRLAHWQQRALPVTVAVGLMLIASQWILPLAMFRAWRGRREPLR